jgi:hypothetical protein
VTFNAAGGSLLLQTPDGMLDWRCYACGDPKTILEEISRRQISRQLSPAEADRFELTTEELNSDESRRPNTTIESRGSVVPAGSVYSGEWLRNQDT